jgi:antiphage defense system Thoeris ThsB-like protein
VNPRGTPQPVFGGHLVDQVAAFGVDAWPSRASRPMRPPPREPVAMPPVHGRRLHQLQRVAPPRPEASMWNANENIDFNFADFQLDEAINSQNPSYIKGVLRNKIRRVDTFVLLIGNDTWQKTCSSKRRSRSPSRRGAG